MNEQNLFKLCNEYLNYNPLTGIIIWKKKSAYKTKIGSEAGTIGNQGYRQIHLRGKKYLTHRVAFLMAWGFLPEYIDHPDRDKLNNKLNNLRECTKSQNCINVGISVTNTSGYKGIQWRGERNKWRARIVNNKGERVYLGHYDCKHEAAQAWNKAALKYHGEFAYQNIIKEK